MPAIAEKILANLIPKKATPFHQLEKYTHQKLAIKLKELGCGCYNAKSRTIFELVNSKLNLSTCEIHELEKIYGIGRKTSRGFVLHSRSNAQCSVLDTHILKFLKENDVPDVPKSTPSSKLEYERLEKNFLTICRKRKIAPAKLDLKVWSSYTK